MLREVRINAILIIQLIGERDRGGEERDIFSRYRSEEAYFGGNIDFLAAVLSSLLFHLIIADTSPNSSVVVFI